MKLFTVHKPLPMGDEDAEPIVNDNIIIVCDGLGGAGQNKHNVDGEIHTSAYLGSRLTAKITDEFFRKNIDTLWENMGQTIENYKSYLSEQLDKYIKDHDLTKAIRGRSAKFLPTTLAMAVFKESDDYIEIISIWAGDSRVYLLTSQKGLQQLTGDDVYDTFDAMDSLGTSSMSNCISGEGSDTFWINYKYYRIDKSKNMFLFACSDGCFDYLSTPMDFEYILERSIMSIPNAADISSIGLYISQLYGSNSLKDDTTISGVIFNDTTTGDLKEQYNSRYADVTDKFTRPTSELEKSKMEARKQFNSNLTTVNIKKRDLLKDIISYVKGVLNPIYATQEDIELKDFVLNLPCMKSYRDIKEEDKKAIESNIKELETELSKKENMLYDIFSNEYRKYKENNTVSSEKSKENDGQIEIKSNYLKYVINKFKTILKDLEELKNYKNGKACIKEIVIHVFDVGEKALKKLEIYQTESTSYKDIDENDDVNYFRENTTEKNNSESSSLKLSKHKIAQEFEKAKDNNFEEYYKTEYDNMFDNTISEHEEIQRLKKQIKSNKEILDNSSTLKYSESIGGYIDRNGSKLFDEILDNDETDNLFPIGLQEKISEFKKIYSIQNNCKTTEQEVQKQIFDLWFQEYKNDYELYQVAMKSGKI